MIGSVLLSGAKFANKPRMAVTISIQPRPKRKLRAIACPPSSHRAYRSQYTELLPSGLCPLSEERHKELRLRAKACQNVLRLYTETHAADEHRACFCARFRFDEDYHIGE
jgi:hypothetical protein